MLLTPAAAFGDGKIVPIKMFVDSWPSSDWRSSIYCVNHGDVIWSDVNCHDDGVIHDASAVLCLDLGPGLCRDLDRDPDPCHDLGYDWTGVSDDGGDG